MFVTFAILVLAQAPATAFTFTTTTDTQTRPWQPLDKTSLANLVSIHSSAPLPAFPRTAGLLLANGDRIPGELQTGDDTSITLGALRVPLPAIRILWLTPIPATTSDFPDRYSWLPSDRKNDIVLLRNGDTLVGDIERFNDGGSLRFKRDGIAMTLEPSAMAAIAFNPSLSAIRKVKGPFARLTLRNGSRISFANLTADAEKLKGATLFGTAMELPVSEIVSLDVQQGKATNLADLKPKSDTVEGFNDLAWPWVANRTVKHQPLRLGAATYDTGLGTHPKTTLTYSLNGKYRRFTAIVGLDAKTGQRGAAVVRILVDGQEQALPKLQKLTGASGAIPVSVDVSKAKELTLVIDFAPGGDVQADVNWADAKLVE